jgi:hypothetical protein
MQGLPKIYITFSTSSPGILLHLLSHLFLESCEKNYFLCLSQLVSNPLNYDIIIFKISATRMGFL